MGKNYWRKNGSEENVDGGGKKRGNKDSSLRRGGGGRGGENLTNGSEVRENKKGSKEEVGEGTMVQNSLIWRNQN